MELRLGMSFLLLTSLACSGMTAPMIGVDAPRTDFGSYPANQVKEHVFVLKNTGDQPLKIVNIRKTCGCSGTRLEKRELSPGETGTLTAVIKGGSIAGPYSKNLFVESTDPKQRFLMLLLSGNAVPLVTVKPQDKIYAGTLPVGKEWQQEFFLETTRDAVAFGKTEIKGLAGVSAALASAGERKFKLVVKFPPAVHAGSFNVKISIPITTPAGWQPVEILISGRRQ